MKTAFVGNDSITVMPLEFEPADRYRIAYNIKGIVLDSSGQPVVSENHIVMITLGAAYPREKPMAITETAIFHPNIREGVGGEVCIGDYWVPAQSLADIVIEVGEMIQYQKYNVKSPLNAVAAQWAATHESIFPIGSVDLHPSEVQGIVLGPSG